MNDGGERQFNVRQSVSAADRAAQLDLRYRVLREPLGMSREQAVFARDDDADTIHLLAVACNFADDAVDAQHTAVAYRLPLLRAKLLAMDTMGPLLQFRSLARSLARRP
jgi:hypothetical protein